MGVGKSTFAFSTSSITIDGGSTTISITRDNQSYSHKLRHGFGDIATLAVGTTSYTWTPTAAQLTKFFQEVPNQKTRQIDVTLDTYNGSTLVGSDIHALTVTLSETTGKPTVSSFSISDSNSTTNGLGVIVDGKSTLTATATPTAKYGATISKNIFTCTYSNKTYESYYINDLIASLPLSTSLRTFTIGYKSTDSRGFSNTSTISKTITRYQAPAIDTFEVLRCNTSGVEADNGTKAKVTIKGSWAAMSMGATTSGSGAYKNPATLKVGYKTKAATSYTYQTISVLGGTVDISQLLSTTLTAGTDYEFSVTLTDTFSESDARSGVGFSNVGNILYVSADGKELVIGSDSGNNVAIDSDSVDIRDGSTVLATFTEDTIRLAQNNSEAAIDMCDGGLQLQNSGGISTLRSANTLRLFSPYPKDASWTAAENGSYMDLTSTSSQSNILLYANSCSLTDSIQTGATVNLNGLGYLNMLSDTSTTIRSPRIYIHAESCLNMVVGTKSAELQDWVKLTGGSGAWTYRKWASGIVECWGYLSVTCTANNWCTGSLSYPFTIKYPRFQITRSSSGEAWSTVGQAFATSTTSSITINTYQTSASSVQFHVYVKGEA